AEGLLPKGAVPRPELGWAVVAHGSAPSLTKADLSRYQAVRRPRNGSVHEDSWAPHPHRTRIRPKKQKQAPDEVKKQASQRGGDGHAGCGPVAADHLSGGAGRGGPR